MADPSPSPNSTSNTGNDTRVRPDRGAITSTPRWVKVFGIIVAVLVLVAVAVMFIGGGHGPGRHTSSGGTGDQVPPSSVIEAHTPPDGVRG